MADIVRWNTLVVVGIVLMSCCLGSYLPGTTEKSHGRQLFEKWFSRMNQLPSSLTTSDNRIPRKRSFNLGRKLMCETDRRNCGGMSFGKKFEIPAWFSPDYLAQRRLYNYVSPDQMDTRNFATKVGQPEFPDDR